MLFNLGPGKKKKGGRKRENGGEICLGRGKKPLAMFLVKGASVSHSLGELGSARN